MYKIPAETMTVMAMKFGTNAIIVLPTTGWFCLLFND